MSADEEMDRIRREIGSVILELDSATDRNVTVVEDRLATLRDLLAEADRRIGILSGERVRRSPDPTVYDRRGQALPVTPQEQSGLMQPPSDRMYRQPPSMSPTVPPATPVTQQSSPPPISSPAPGAIAVNAAAAVPERQTGAGVPFIRFSDKPVQTAEPFAEKVIALYRRGFSTDIIAAKLEATMAEVDLVLSLEREREERSKER